MTSDKIKDCCKTSKKFYLMIVFVIVCGVLVTASYQGYADQVQSIVGAIILTLVLGAIGFTMWVTFKCFGLFCGIFRIEKHEDEEERFWLGGGCVILPISLIIIFNHIASNIEWIVRVYSLG